MKKIITIIAILISCNISNAQEDAIVPISQLGVFGEELDKTYYYKDVDNVFDKFIGTWKFTNATKELIAVVYKTVHQDRSSFYTDGVYIKLKYTDNGITIYDNLNSTDDNHYVEGCTTYDLSGNKLNLLYQEPTNLPVDDRYPGGPRLKLEYLPCSLGCLPELKWEIDYVLPNNTAVWPYKIPTNLVLTKQ